MTITGASGSGKSLLLRSLADLDPHQGRIFLGNVEHMSIPAPQWRKKVALLPSKSTWWHDTVAQHFPEVNKPYFQALGFGTDVLKWNIDRLSTGEQQRLALLRLLANQPSVLLLDEPTASLDPDNTHLTEVLVLDYAQQNQAPVLWVSHDPEQARRLSKQHYVLSPTRLERAST